MEKRRIQAFFFFSRINIVNLENKELK